MRIVKKISMKMATNTVMALLSCVVVFHLLILVGVIPYAIVWGGRLESASQMYVFEAVSLAINLGMMLVIGVKGGYVKPCLSHGVVRAILWVLVILFLLNTVGNLFSLSTLESIVFTPLTLVSALLCYRMVIEE